MTAPGVPRGHSLPTEGRTGTFALPDGGQAGHLWGSKCSDCGTVGFPPQRFCSRCSSRRVERVRLSNRGVLHTWSTVYQDPGPSFIGTKPYTIVTVQLPEGLRVVSTLSQPLPSKPLRQGLDMELDVIEVARDQHGSPLYDFRFRLA